MATLNSCSFIGYTGRDCEMRYLTTGVAKAEFSLAVSYKPRDKDEQTEWVNCILWGDRAERIAQYITKGKLLYVSGRLQTRNWEDDQGVKHYRSEINVNDLQFLDRREGGQQDKRQASPQYDDDLPF